MAVAWWLGSGCGLDVTTAAATPTTTSVRVGGRAIAFVVVWILPYHIYRALFFWCLPSGRSNGGGWIRILHTGRI